MRLTCPCCGAVASLEALLTDRAAREAVGVALAFPAGLGDRLLRYLGLFRSQGRALGWDRVARLLNELNEAVSARQVERNGQVWAAPLEAWQVALDQILDSRPTLILPLKSHGYLYEILAGLARKAGEQRAARAEIADERARARQGDRQGGPQSAAVLAQNAKNIGGMLENGNRLTTSRDGAVIDTQTGEILTETRPARVPPPPDFRRLAQTLLGKPSTPLEESHAPLNGHDASPMPDL